MNKKLQEIFDKNPMQIEVWESEYLIKTVKHLLAENEKLKEMIRRRTFEDAFSEVGEGLEEE